jgi:phage shock protein PspC (stress-responsive transcriptional regulator)
LQSLNYYFAHQPGGQEIISDIESRIAELFSNKINENQEAVTLEWVDEVMDKMGRIEDFMETEPSHDNQPNYKLNSEKTKRRLYRDTENGVIGGVCSGLSTYFNTDPVFIRIIFIALVFLGIGISIIVYLVLWIVVPKATTSIHRLEMKGEEPTIYNIQKIIQQEVMDVKERVSRINQSESFREGKKAARKAYNDFRNGFTEVFSRKK